MQHLNCGDFENERLECINQLFKCKFETMRKLEAPEPPALGYGHGELLNIMQKKELEQKLEAHEINDLLMFAEYRSKIFEIEQINGANLRVYLNHYFFLIEKGKIEYAKKLLSAIEFKFKIEVPINLHPMQVEQFAFENTNELRYLPNMLRTGKASRDEMFISNTKNGSKTIIMMKG